MAVDTTFEFEQRRNRPLKYNRDQMGQTLAAMQRVREIQGARAQRHFDQRVQDAKAEKKAYARVEIEKSIDLLAPAVASREQVMRNVVDKARARIAKRKKMVGQKATTATAASTDAMQED